MNQPLHILSLQPYYDGSHRNLMKSWQKYSRHQWTTLSLPARHWKWRMRHSAIEFATQLRKLDVAKYDLIFTTDMLNVAEFKGVSPKSVSRLPVVVYFHENQVAYPCRFPDKRDLHFAFTNLTTALAADDLWFNSKYNLDSFTSGLQACANEWPDYPPDAAIREVERKAKIRHPGIDPPTDMVPKQTDPARPLHILWCARWEFDKNPDALLAALRVLKTRQFQFQLSVIGQSFAKVPEALLAIKREFNDELLNYGFMPSRDSYWRALMNADVFVSTANHEFFGIAVAEAMMAGTIPVLPKRVAYPELLNFSVGPSADDFLYESEDDLIAKIEALEHLRRSQPNQWDNWRSTIASRVHRELNWPAKAISYDELLNQD